MNHLGNRKFIVGAIFVLICLIFIFRLFFIQVYDSKYVDVALKNAQRKTTVYPARGLIYDRNKDLLVYSRASYALMVIPSQIKNIDTLHFCKIIDIKKEDFKNILKDLTTKRGYAPNKGNIFIKQISQKQYALFQERLYKFPGFYTQPRAIRSYKYNSSAKILGYVNEVELRDLKNKYYKIGDYIGKSGIERTYEKNLRGEKGQKLLLVDVHNNVKGSLKEGKYDKPAKLGDDITLTIDGVLQRYGEKLMQNKKGSIVAIEPSSGEILSLVSVPDYDPSLLVGRNKNKYYPIIQKDTLKPEFNRAIMATYAPGSIFKLVQALIGLQENTISEWSKFPCHGGYGKRLKPGCHFHKSPLNLKEAIQQSCNSYFCHVFRGLLESRKYTSVQDAYKLWRKHVTSFGFGSRLGIDIPSENPGFIPREGYYKRITKDRYWKAMNIISLSIGQGELIITPLQMANMTAAIANRGFYYTPHLVKDIAGNKNFKKEFNQKKYTTIENKYFEPVIDGMEMVIHDKGTGSKAAIKGIKVCGKTGTVENSQGMDNSVFVAFAPRENPKIAIAVYVENGYWGGRWAAPIASLMIEKYINGEISEERKPIEEQMIKANLLKRFNKSE